MSVRALSAPKPEAEPEWEVTKFRLPNRRAALAQCGIVAGIVHSAGSGLAQLAIRVSATEFVFLPGDWRSIAELGELIGREVEVVEGVGSAHGVHSIALLDDNLSEDKEENGGNC